MINTTWLDLILYPLSPILFGIPQVIESVKTKGKGLSISAWCASFVFGLYYTWSSFVNGQYGLFINMLIWMTIYIILITLAIHNKIKKI